jgi:hypothetical protein
VTLSFDRGELYRALEHPDFEGHGMREIVLLVAAASSSAALMASTASGQVLDGGGGSSSGAVGAAVIPGHDEASTASALAASGVVVPGHDEAATASALAASTTAHDELGAQARGLGQTIPGNDEATLTARGIDPAIATAIGTGDATTARDLATAPAPATPGSGSSFEVPSLDAGTAAVVGGLAGASLLILGGAFAVRRQRVTPV